jgi:hypothetical protein
VCSWRPDHGFPAPFSLVRELALLSGAIQNQPARRDPARRDPARQEYTPRLSYGLTAQVFALLGVGQENARSVSEMMPLIKSASRRRLAIVLSGMCETGRIGRCGEKRHFRYFKFL